MPALPGSLVGPSVGSLVAASGQCRAKKLPRNESLPSLPNVCLPSSLPAVRRLTLSMTLRNPLARGKGLLGDSGRGEELKGGRCEMPTNLSRDFIQARLLEKTCEVSTRSGVAQQGVKMANQWPGKKASLSFFRPVFRPPLPCQLHPVLLATLLVRPSTRRTPPLQL